MLAGLAVLITGDQIEPLVGIAALGVDQRRRRRLEARADAQIQVAARLDAAIAQRIGIDRLVGHLAGGAGNLALGTKSEEHTSELQSLMRISYAVFCLKKKKHILKSH